MPRPRTYAGITRYSLERMPATLKAARKKRKVSLRAAAPQIGIGKTTLVRAESGQDVDIKNLVKIFAWLDGST